MKTSLLQSVRWIVPWPVSRFEDDWVDFFGFHAFIHSSERICPVWLVVRLGITTPKCCRSADPADARMELVSDTEIMSRAKKQWELMVREDETLVSSSPPSRD